MKKAGIVVLLALTVLYAAFLTGLFVTRNRTVGLLSFTGPTASGEAERGKVDLNTATAQELMVLPGIGEGLARRIIEYRERYGPFPDISALTEVKGIGEKLFAEIADYITVGG